MRAFIRENANKYIDELWGDADLWELIVALKKEAEFERGKGKRDIPLIANCCETDERIKETVIQHILYRSQKSRDECSRSSFQTLEALMWQYGYTKGLLKAHLYSDVLPEIQKWKKAGIKIYTISSSSARGRKILFANTVYGDISHSLICLTSLLSALKTFQLFDGHVGKQIPIGKIDEHVYKVVAESVEENIASCLFLVESMPEAKAIHNAGGDCALVCRIESKNYSKNELDDISAIKSFEDIEFFGI
ncbi:enolase-phosphatase E1-like protein [Dinothrombium tinctorium]|uniref:Enolase-phosphatase E1-like protein n=1 Tax=Dinothrombium tinctorium TaxID=1965070 RepID=A0A3S3SCL9_9ACAR|nr:enolase-phosphatase E1-like protein [Dinothrombium tinctorium]RWS12317.1 enolase-phosphatase E1-like protein [Dinothrombium tinctorium]